MSPYCWYKLECRSNMKKEKEEKEEEEFKKGGYLGQQGSKWGIGKGGWRFDLRERDCPCS